MKLSPQLKICTLLLSTVTFATLAADRDEDTLKSLEQTWITAVSSTDRVTLEKLLDDSFVETTPAGSRRSKSDLLLATPPAPGSTQKLMDLDVKVKGDTAIVRGINHFTPARGTPGVDYLFTDVFVREADGWRAVSSQMTRK